MSKNYDVEDFSKMIQCFLDCGKDVELGIQMYKNKYPDRQKRLLFLLCNIVQDYDHSKKDKQLKEFIKSLDDSIVNYFAKNSHATIRKAACIFSVPVRYVSHILVKREKEIQAKKKEYEERLNESIQETIEQTKQTLKQEILGISDSEEKMLNNSQEKLNIKVEENENVIEVSESETADSDIVYCETETKKRKKKNSKRSKSNKRKATHFPSHSPSTSYSQWNLNAAMLDIQIRTPIVYTTRLEEMTLCHKNIDHLDNAVIISEILAESKPQFNNIIPRSNQKVIKTICLELMNIVLNKLMNKKSIADSSEKAYNNNDDNEDEVVVVTHENNIVLNKLMNKNSIADSSEKAYNNNDDNEDEVVVVTHENNTLQKGNLLQTPISTLHVNTDVIVIDNMFSNLRDTYIIGGGKLLEYHCTKLDTDELEKISGTKFTLNVCCWFGRQQNVEIMWPSDKYPFSRFLRSRHECSLDKCTCCCKPLNDFTELITSVHKSANDDFNYVSMEESDEKKNDPILLAALNYKKPVANEHIINKVDNPRRNSHLWIATRVLISDSLNCMNRNEYYEIDGDKDIIRFHVDNHWHSGRFKCKVCTIITATFGGKYTKTDSACCKWRRDLLLRPFVSPNSLRLLQNVNRYKYDKCSVCHVKSQTVNKKTAFSFDVIPRIGHATVNEKCTLTNFSSTVSPPDVHNTTQPVEMPVVMSTFEVRKKLIIQCKELPNLIFELGNLKDQQVTNVIDKLMHLHCTVKDDSKIVGMFDSSLQSTSAEELQMFAQIIQHMQNHLKLTPLPSGSALSFITEIKDDFKNCNNQSGLQPELGNQVTVLSSDSKAGNMSNETFQNPPPPATKTSATAESIPNTFIHNNIVADKLEKSLSFDKFYRHSKKCYDESFRSYVKYENSVENEIMTIPKISSVFSLQSSTQCRIPANQSFLTETVSSLPSTSYCNKGNVQNDVILNANVETNVIPYPHATLPSMVQKTGQEMIICDFKTGQLFNLIPVDPNAIFESSIKQNIVTIQEGGESENQLKLLPVQSDPLNVSNPNIPIMTASYNSMESESILPDILNDIPKHVIVKNEPCNEDVIVLDSD